MSVNVSCRKRWGPDRESDVVCDPPEFARIIVTRARAPDCVALPRTDQPLGEKWVP